MDVYASLVPRILLFGHRKQQIFYTILKDKRPHKRSNAYLKLLSLSVASRFPFGFAEKKVDQ